jgi:hypothetical protein
MAVGEVVVVSEVERSIVITINQRELFVCQWKKNKKSESERASSMFL